MFFHRSSVFFQNTDVSPVIPCLIYGTSLSDSCCFTFGQPHYRTNKVLRLLIIKISPVIHIIACLLLDKLASVL